MRRGKQSPKIRSSECRTDRNGLVAKGNYYTTFKLEDGNCLLDVFTWGHPTVASGEKVQIEGVFEVEHHQGKYTFYNEVQATSVNPK